MPAALVGALFEEPIDEHLGTPAIIAVSLILGGLLLAVGRPHGRAGARSRRYGARDALVVGAAQALALNPGTSRSGITITAGRFRGFDRDAAARLSFLMMIPVTAGAVVFKMGGLAADGIPSGLPVPMLVGIVDVGRLRLVAVWGTLTLVRTHSFMPFVIYRVVVGVVVLIVVAAGWR